MSKKTAIIARVALEMELPMVPNFIRVGRDHDGVAPKVSLGELEDDAIKAYGAAYTEALLARAKEQRRASGKEPTTPLDDDTKEKGKKA